MGIIRILALVLTLISWMSDGRVAGVCKTSTSNSLTCPPPWLAYQSHCYLWVDQEMSWQDADNHCQMLSQLGKMAHLVSIHSAEEDEFISEYVQKASGLSPPPGYWIGYNDRTKEWEFKWVDGSKGTYENWGMNEPNEAGDEDCVERYRVFNKWNDINCSLRINFVCKM